jgi:hypothetical protein
MFFEKHYLFFEIFFCFSRIVSRKVNVFAIPKYEKMTSPQAMYLVSQAGMLEINPATDFRARASAWRLGSGGL